MSQRRCGQGIEIVGEALPVPRHALAHHQLGDVLDAFHDLDQRVAVLRPAGREADAAIAHHHGGHAVARGRREALVPGRLPVIVGVDVDEARRDGQALGVDLLAPGAGNAADGGDAAVLARRHRPRAAGRPCRRARCRCAPPDRIEQPWPSPAIRTRRGAKQPGETATGKPARQGGGRCRVRIMNETDLCYTPATELADAIRAKKLSAVEITSAVLNRIKRLEPKLNAFAYLAAEEAMDAAQAADRALAKGEPIGPLHGVPVTIKDHEAVARHADRVWHLPAQGRGRGGRQCDGRAACAARAPSSSARRRRPSSAGWASATVR